jgi:hypothetical protein
MLPERPRLFPVSSHWATARVAPTQWAISPSPLAVARATLAVKAQNGQSRLSVGQAARAGFLLSHKGRGNGGSKLAPR